MRHLRAVSPSYGGGTINASFELLTGLPARGPLGGMIYQEYAEAFSNKAITVAQQLERDGYRSIAIHPYKRNFFQRDVVLPKFGFERFISIEDMSYSGPMRWADDLLLYEAALRELSIRPRNNFFFLTTVYSHGGYKFQSDFGESDYIARLTLSLERLSAFIREVRQHYPDTLILVLADHKPALTRYFYEQGVLPTSEFGWTGERNEDFQFTFDSSDVLRGDVPVYISYDDNAREAEFVARANGKPFFCLAEILDDIFVGSGLPAFEHSKKGALCSTFEPSSYRELVREYPSWLYGLSLFDVP